MTVRKRPQTPWRPMVFALAVFVAFVAVATAQDATPTTRGRDRTESPGPDDERGNGTARDERPGGERKPSRLSVEGDRADGRYVDFRFDPSTCAISDYRVYNVSFFSSIRLGAPPCETGRGPQDRGAFSLGNRDVNVRIHDAPNGLIRFEADEGASIVFSHATGLSVNQTAGAVTLATSNLSAKMFLSGRGNDTEGTLSSTASETNVTAGVGNFVVHPASGASAERRAVFDAIAQGKVGAEIDVLRDSGGAVTESLVFDEVSVKVRQAQKEKFEVEVAANLTQGRAFVTNLDPSLLGSGRIRVDYFDVDAKGRARSAEIRGAESLEDVLAATPGEAPEHWIFSDADGLHAIVSVPRFSVHMFAVVGLPLQVVPLVLYGIILAGLFFAAGGIGVYLERHRGK